MRPTFTCSLFPEAKITRKIPEFLTSIVLIFSSLFIYVTLYKVSVCFWYSFQEAVLISFTDIFTLLFISLVAVIHI